MLCLGLLGQNPRLVKQHFPDVQLGDESPVKIVCIDGRLKHSKGIWGTVAEQLGRAEIFSHLYSPPQAPDPDDWRKLLAGERVLILIDELPFYLDNCLATTIGDSNLCKVTAAALTSLLVACAEGGECRQTAVVMTDLNADAYPDGSQTIQQVANQVLATLGGEAERILETLQPIELETNDLYHILRRRLFKEDPDPEAVKKISESYREALRKAADNHYCTGDPTTLAKDIRDTYPFSPAIKHLAARFRNNDGFQQTRGMLRLYSKVVKDLYESGKAAEALLIGPEHLNLADKSIRDQIKKINKDLENALSKDFYQTGGTARLQQITDDGEITPGAVNDAALIILFASLSHRPAELGLTPSELGTWYAAPDRDITLLPKLWARLQDTCDYLHRTDPDNKLLFRPVENILVWVRRRATEIGEASIQKRLAAKLQDLFKAEVGSVYQKVEAFPSIADLVLDKERTTLVILSPQQRGGLPADALEYWKGQRYKNRLLFLTGLKGGFANLSEYMRVLIATEEALERKDLGAPERRMLEEQKERAMTEFREAMIHCFDTVFFPVDNDNFDRASFRMEYKDDGYRGARQVTTHLEIGPGKFQPWDEGNITGNRDYAQEELFDGKVMRWNDIKENAAIRASWPMTDSGWLDQLKFACVASDWWREVGADQIERGPFERKTTLSVIPIRQADGKARLSIKPTPQGATVKFCPGTTFDPAKALPVHDLAAFETDELQGVFRCEDDTAGQWATGDDVPWQGTPELKRGPNPSPIEFKASHGAEIWYTTDGTKPEPGKSSKYVGPITPADDCSVVQAVAESQGLYSTPMSVSVSKKRERKGRVRYRSTSLSVKGPAQINAAITQLATAKAEVESASIRFALEAGGAVELQLQGIAFAPATVKAQMEALAGSLGEAKEHGEERLIDLFQLIFPSHAAFEEWVKAQGVRYQEKDLEYVG